MKVTRLTEGKEVVLKTPLTENVNEIREKARVVIDERIDHALDNLAIQLAHEVEGYNPDWCVGEWYGDAVNQLQKAQLAFCTKLENMLFANAPMNEKLAEAVKVDETRYAVVKPDGTYAGVPCQSFEEAREMAAAEDGREVFELKHVPMNESYDENGNHEKCAECGALLNDMGTCPRCDGGEEDLGDDEEDDLREKLELNEDLLQEGPGLRSLGRKILNKVAPGGAVKREIKGHEKDEKEHRAKKAPPILARDFTTKAQRYKFYPNVPGNVVMNFDQWNEKYADAKTDEEYAQWYNAIVTDEDGYYIRRGSENLKGKLVKYMRGDNDEVLKMYRVDPYTYYGKTNDDPVPPVPPKKDDDEDEEDDKKKKKPPKKKGTKKTVPIADKDLNRFIQLCRLTSFRVYALADPEKQLTVNELKAITTPTLDQYIVSTKYQKKPVNLSDWMQTAKKLKFLEQFERHVRGSLNESLLTEAPKITLDDADLMNPDTVDFKSMIKKAQDEEDKKFTTVMLQNMSDKALQNAAGLSVWEDKIDSLHSDLVPTQGIAPSLGGEIVRAAVRLIYRDRNDGDIFFDGYGLETCGSSAMFLYENGFDSFIDSIMQESTKYLNMMDEKGLEDFYGRAIDELGMEVVKRIEENPDLLLVPNDVDSRTMDYEYIKEHAPTYDFEFYGSDEVCELVEAEILNSWKLKEYVEQQLGYHDVCRAAEVERPWTHYDTSVTVTNLGREAYDFIKDDLFSDADYFWADLVGEYTDELENLRNGYDEDEDIDDDVEEALIRDERGDVLRIDDADPDFIPPSSSYDFMTGNDVISGMAGNMGDAEMDKQLRELSRVARRLKLKRADDLVCYCDSEWMYDPTMFDSRFYTLPETPEEFEVDGVRLVAQRLNGNIWLYFASEADGNRYLTYCDMTA